METIGLVMEKMRKIESCAMGRLSAGFCLPSASNQPIWPPLATMTVAPGMVPLSISRRNTSDIRCKRDGDSPSDSGFASGKGGVCSACAGRAAVCADMTVSLYLLSLSVTLIFGAAGGQEQERAGALFGRFALAIWPRPMLETARIGRQRRSVQECSSIGRAPVSKTGGRRFEPCHSCQRNQIVRPDFRVGAFPPKAQKGTPQGTRSLSGACKWLSRCPVHPVVENHGNRARGQS